MTFKVGNQIFASNPSLLEIATARYWASARYAKQGYRTAEANLEALLRSHEEPLVNLRRAAFRHLEICQTLRTQEGQP